MTSPTVDTNVPTPDVSNSKQSEMDDLMDKLRDALSVRETGTDIPEGYCKFTSGLTTLLMGLLEQQSKKLKDQEAVSDDPREQPGMHSLLAELAAASQEQTERLVDQLREQNELLEKQQEDLKQTQVLLESQQELNEEGIKNWEKLHKEVIKAKEDSIEIVKKIKFGANTTIGLLLDMAEDAYGLFQKVLNELSPDTGISQEVNSYLTKWREGGENSLKIEEGYEALLPSRHETSELSELSELSSDDEEEAQDLSSSSDDTTTPGVDLADELRRVKAELKKTKDTLNLVLLHSP